MPDGADKKIKFALLKRGETVICKHLHSSTSNAFRRPPATGYKIPILCYNFIIALFILLIIMLIGNIRSWNKNTNQ